MPDLPKNMYRRKDRPGFHARIVVDGRRRWFTLGTDETEARGELKRLRKEGPSATSKDDEDAAPTVSFRDAAEQWLASYVSNARNAYGVKQTTDRVRRFLEPFMGQLPIAEVSAATLRGFRPWLERKGLAPQTVRHILADARCLLRWAADEGLIERSPFPKRLMPKIQECPPDRLTDEEIAAVVAIKGAHGFAVRLALATGLRWGELTRAQSGDIVKQGARLVLVVHHTKSTKIRRVPVRAWFVDELRARMLAGKLVSFASPGQFNKAVRRLSGVKRFHVHQCRHTFACRWLEEGGSLAALQQQLGHASIVTTQRYGRISDDLVAREAERLDDAGGSGRHGGLQDSEAERSVV